MLNGEIKPKAQMYVEKDFYLKEKTELLQKLSDISQKQQESESALKDMKTFCKMYSQLYMELKMDLLHTKHNLLKDFDKEDAPSEQFYNTPNGVSLDSHNSEDSDDQKTPKHESRVEELEKIVKQLRVENSELRRKLQSSNSRSGSEETSKLLDKENC